MMPHDPTPIDPPAAPQPSLPERRARYAEQLRRPEWQRRRDAILGRDGRRCRQCGAGHDLVVHHRQYHSDRRTGEWLPPWAYEDRYLITLCTACHDAGHARYPIPSFTV
jgi:5-methylcytosine-specific restriction endonuclease McrA